MDSINRRPKNIDYRDWEKTIATFCVELALHGKASLSAPLTALQLQMGYLASGLIHGKYQPLGCALHNLVLSEMCLLDVKPVEPSQLVKLGYVADLPRFKKVLLNALEQKK